jgi:hypothetical protein
MNRNPRTPLTHRVINPCVRPMAVRHPDGETAQRTERRRVALNRCSSPRWPGSPPWPLPWRSGTRRWSTARCPAQHAGPMGRGRHPNAGSWRTRRRVSRRGEHRSVVRRAAPRFGGAHGTRPRAAAPIRRPRLLRRPVRRSRCRWTACGRLGATAAGAPASASLWRPPRSCRCHCVQLITHVPATA